MFFVLVTIGSLLIALLRGRTPDDIVRQPFRVWPLALLGFILHLVVNLPWFSAPLAVHLPAISLSLGAGLYLASFISLIFFLLANRTQAGFVVLLLGLGLNFAAIVANGGQMPGDPRPLAQAGLLDNLQQQLQAGLWSPFAIIDRSTRLSLLCDWILVPLPFRNPVVMSLGDMVIGVGCFLFCNAPFRRSTRFSTRRFGLGG